MSRFLKSIIIDGIGGTYHSFNNTYHLVSVATKAIIVGTITSPQGRGLNKDFYYMSPYNPMYRIIDNYFLSINKSSNLVTLKKEGNIPLLIEELSQIGIAFLDVIESCNNPHNSSLDDDLIDIKLDYEAFKDINEDIVLLANSKNAYQGLLKIKEHNKLNNIVKLVYGFRFYKQEDWNQAFRDINL